MRVRTALETGALETRAERCSPRHMRVTGPPARRVFIQKSLLLFELQ